LSPSSTQTPKQEEDSHGGDTPEDVWLNDPFSSDLRLRLIESNLNDTPTDSVESRLEEDDMTKPSMKEVEVVVW
jgi:hypothetical protein